MNHKVSKTILISNVCELIAKRYKIAVGKARDLLFASNTIKLIDNDETGLYGESPQYVFSLFEEEMKNSRNK